MLLVCHRWQSLLLSMPAGWANISLASNKKCGSLLLQYTKWPLRHQVKFLSLEFCNKLTNNMLEALSAFPNLTSLNLNGCSSITDDALKFVAKCNLEHLELFWNPALTHQGILHLTQGPYVQNLTHLNLSGVKYLTDEAISGLVAKLPRLHHLDLTRLERLRDPALVAISRHCPELRVLLLYACANFTDEGILAIAEGCSKLENLDLAGAQKVSDAALAAVAAKCPNLSWLNCVWCLKLTDDTLFALGAHCRRLAFLSVHGNQHVTPQGLARLRACGKLEALDINGCKLIPDRSLAFAQSLIPSLQKLIPL